MLASTLSLLILLADGTFSRFVKPNSFFQYGPIDTGSSTDPEFNEKYEKLYEDLYEYYSDIEDVPTNVGKPYPTITGPPSLDSKIAIIGAGPSGSHMAYQLKMAGYTNIHLFEQTYRVGGKSDDVLHRGTYNSLSTMFFNPDYNETLEAFVLKYKLGNLLPYDVIVREVNDWRVTPSFNYLQDELDKVGITVEEYFDITRQYVDFYRDLFGIFPGRLMREPDEETMKKLQGSFYDFLKDNGFEDIGFGMDHSLEAYGYGNMHTTSAIRGAILFTPRNVVEGILGHGNMMANVKGGFSEIFRTMLRMAEVEPKFEHKLLAIRKARGKFYLTFSVSPEEQEFDFVMWSGQLNDFPKIARDDLISDDADRTILESVAYRHTVGAVVNMKNDQRYGLNEFYRESFPTDNTFRNLAQLSADPYAIYNEVDPVDYANRNYYINGVSANDTYRTISVFNFGDPITENGAVSDAQVRENIISLYRDCYNATDIDILTVKHMAYFPQWSHKAMGEGVLWRFLEMQGKYGVWFLGGAGAVDATMGVLEYNNLLLRLIGIEPVV